MTAPLPERFAVAMALLAPDLSDIGIAVSGGSDSTALLLLSAEWARDRNLHAVTVDHGLRPEAADEARQVAALCARLGVQHETLHWLRPEGSGNLMAQAREGRMQLMSAWAARHGLSAVLLGHTMDDQAETVLMRLGRGAGIDGLSGMAARREAVGTLWLRPLLDLRRQDLRDYLRAKGQTWADDPSNDDDSYMRVRIRQAVSTLGLDVEAIAASAAHLAQVRGLLDDITAGFVTGARDANGSLFLNAPEFAAAPLEVRRRILIAALRWMTADDYAPRSEKIAHVLDAIGAGTRATLAGVIIDRKGDDIAFTREPEAARRHKAVPDLQGEALWDRRWQLQGLPQDTRVAAVGFDPLPGWNWRDSGLSRDQAAASPGVWRGSELIAAPLLLSDANISAKPLRALRHFRAVLFSH